MRKKNKERGDRKDVREYRKKKMKRRDGKKHKVGKRKKL